MSSTPVKRKLSAILAADAVGYSRMMGANEEATLKTLSAHRAVIDSIIEFHDGRIVGTAGNSVLAEFGSPVEAVRCAVEIQDALKTRNDSLPEDRRLQFRVGVNVAARLESIAEPGGICISASVYDLIRGKLDLGFHDIGEQSLKNIEHPIRVYRVARDAGAPGAGGRKAPRKSRPFAGALAGLVVLAAAAAGYAYFVWLPEQRAAEQAELARVKAAAEKTAAEKAAAEKAAAEKAAARTKPAAVVAAPIRRYDGAWTAAVVCEALNGLPERTFRLHARAENDAFRLRHGRPGEPGFLGMRGAPDAEGRLVLRGHGLSGRLSKQPGTPIRARFEGRFEGGRYEGSGHWDKPPCSALLTRAG